ncbi:MAG TPA: hypothetical protein VMW24_10810 [Sedimentisphaerales bacterium]|nr:hypothetical protein [Sedimentisphaerales bacterium]
MKRNSQGRIQGSRTHLAGSVGLVRVDNIELSTDQECRTLNRAVFRKGCPYVDKEWGQGIYVD